MYYNIVPLPKLGRKLKKLGRKLKV